MFVSDKAFGQIFVLLFVFLVLSTYFHNIVARGNELWCLKVNGHEGLGAGSVSKDDLLFKPVQKDVSSQLKPHLFSVSYS